MWGTVGGVAILSYVIYKRNLWSVYLLMFAITLLQFSYIKPNVNEIDKGKYCKVERVKVNTYNTQLFCSCKTNRGIEFKSILYYSSDQNIYKGEVYEVNKKFTRIVDENLPHEFSYAEYLNKKGIYFESGGITNVHLRKVKDKSFSDELYIKTKQWINICLNQYLNKDKVALVQALCFGDKSEVDESMMTSFRNAGLMHIIAVSGMHVGLIQYILLVVLRLFFGRKAGMVILQQGIVVLCLIGFAWLCQFSLSIVRSVFMFSILYYTILSKRVLFPIHGLFLSAFVLLLYNPLQIFDLGFQFSYIATFGLLYMSRYIIDWGFVFKKKWMRWIVQASLISLIAQVFLSPLLFYYFGELPIWFLVFNIPGFLFVSIIIILVALFFVSMPIHDGLSRVIAQCIDYIITGFEYILSLTTYSETLYLKFPLNNFTEVIIYSLMIVCTLHVVIFQHWRKIKYGLLLSILLICVKIHTRYINLTRIEGIVWNTKDEKAITYKLEDTVYYFTSYMPTNEGRVQNYLKSTSVTIQHRFCDTKDGSELSNLYKVKAGVGDTITCVLYTNNQDLQNYLTETYPDAYIQYLYFNTSGKTYNLEQFGGNEQILKYGLSLISNQNTIYFYP